MSNGAGDATEESARQAIAGHFVQARRTGQSLPEFPGRIPATLIEAYRVQDAAIARWPDTIVGWKIGYIADGRRDAAGDERLLGPVFSRGLWQARPDLPVPVFAAGFAAVEAEFILRLDADAPTGKDQWSPEEAAAFPASLYTGMEVASSPLASINELGPCAVVSDFGNHNGLVLGEPLGDWQRVTTASLICQTLIDGTIVGDGGAHRLPGGLGAALAFALSRSARRGRPLCKGMLIATGNTTGIHDIRIGQTAKLRFGGHGEIICRAVAAS